MTEQGKSMSLVTGYLPKDGIPRHARSQGLLSRCAVIIDTSGDVDIVLDGRLFFLAVKTVHKILHASNVLQVTWRPQRARPCTMEQVETALGLADPEVPDEIAMLSPEGAVQALLVHEPWWRLGGPAPYHDSLTVAVYTKEALCPMLESELRDVCSVEGASITDVVGGSASPQKSDLARWLLRARRRPS